MKAIDVVTRARSAMTAGTCQYKLGMGGGDPTRAVPWNDDGQCDCSGFVAWCLNLPRKTDHPWYIEQNGGWLETTAIQRDIQRDEAGIFRRIADSKAYPGCIIVYGDAGSKQGHVGIVASVGHDRILTVIHCSKGNYAAHDDAIWETDPAVFLNHHALVGTCVFIDPEWEKEYDEV